MMSFFERIPVGRRTLLMTLSMLLPILFLVAVKFGIQDFSILKSRREIVERLHFVYFDLVVTGEGRGNMAGYFGWVIQPDNKHWYSRLSFVSVLPPVDIHDIAIQAENSGYETTLVTEPPDYDPYLPRVTVMHCVLLYPNSVWTKFSIIILENGYLTVEVGSAYFLLDGWMRSVFREMFQDLELSPDTISLFKLEVDWIGELHF